MSHVLTPTEELLMEVLAARTRLGECFWTFSTRSAITKAAKNLEAKGLVFLMGGQTENTFRAGLTDTGKAETMSKTYVSPAEKRWMKTNPEQLKKILEGILG